LVSEKQSDLVLARELMEAGKFRTVVDRAFPLDRAADAHRYAESGAKRGPVVISITSGREARPVL
jgi:NADPH:quinone reductase-like Zn-dependent oxidoreductase